MPGQTRLRRTLVYAAVFTGLQGVIVTAASLAQIPAIRHAHEASLARQAAAIVHDLAQEAPPLTREDLQAAVARAEDVGYADLLGERGERWLTSDPALEAALPPVAHEAHDALELQGVEVGGSARGPARAATQAILPFRDADGRRRLLRAVADGSARDVALQRLADRLWIVLPASFLAAALASWLLLRHTLGPLRVFSESVRRLGPETLTDATPEIDLNEADEDLARLQRSLAEAIERIEEGYQAQSEFVANVAHELKTPIAVLLAEAQSLPGATATADDLEAFRRSAIEELRRLGKLIESFLVVARAARGGSLTRDETVFLPEIVVDAVQHTRGPAAAHGVTVRPLLPAADTCAVLETTGDPELLGSMLQNLIRNAIRYSPEGGVVDVVLELVDARARLAVRDRGPGVPEHIASRLFDRYVQAEPGSDREGRTARGFGLGLSIAANVARLHGGDIGVRNHAGGGAVFTVHLPLGPPRPTAGVTPDGP